MQLACIAPSTRIDEPRPPALQSSQEVSVPTLRDILDQKVREADHSLYEKLESNRVRCFSCGHCCPIP